MGADWQRLLTSAACRLFYVHFDERGNSATLGFETREFPADPLPEWVEKELNAFEFHLVFTGLEGLRVTGWGYAEAGQIEVAVRGAQLFDVSLGSGTSGISFRASAVRLAKSRAYLASDSF
ncbi:Imm50 family immunity protein [Streptomyces sp. NPDC001663]|uniref:Imm50 family immunity protein n=1 Tax=Streptomyces sp. NPDC001663 TaxID=3364597 RepID=UPI0036C8A9C9